MCVFHNFELYIFFAPMKKFNSHDCDKKIFSEIPGFLFFQRCFIRSLAILNSAPRIFRILKISVTQKYSDLTRIDGLA